MRRKALMAIVFAGGLLNAQRPALSESDAESKSKSKSRSKSSDSIEQQIANNAQLAPAHRAYYLLMIANSLLKGKTKTEVEEQFKSSALETSKGWLFSHADRWDSAISDWANKVSIEGMKDGVDRKLDATPGSPPISHESLALANTAMKQALKELDKVSDPFARLNLYFIASKLFQKMGNVEESQKYKNIVDRNIQLSVGNAAVDERQAKAAVSILNSMANGLIPVQISDQRPSERPGPQQAKVQAFTEKNFEESKKLKLRIVAIVDQLNSKDHLRRKAHRDLALWYMQLGKSNLADQEKQILFKLVGISDDSILYPSDAGCGHFVWWEKSKDSFGMDCGMG